MATVKQGIVYSIVSLMVASFFIIVFSAPTIDPLETRADLSRFRISILDTYTDRFDDYIEQVIRVTAQRSLRGMNEYTTNEGYFSSPADVEAAFVECMLNGTASQGVDTRNCSTDGTRPPTLLDRIDAMVTQSEQNMNLDIAYTITGINLTQSYPFTLTITAAYNYTISDFTASLTKHKQRSFFINVEGIKDPLFQRYHNDARRIQATAIGENDWNNNTLAQFITNRSYRHYNNSPSVFQRFQGAYSATSDCCGIEAVFSADVEPYVTLTGTTENASTIDHYYYGARYGSETFNCSNVPAVENIAPHDSADVQIDESHLVLFNITPANWGDSC